MPDLPTAPAAHAGMPRNVPRHRQTTIPRGWLSQVNTHLAHCRFADPGAPGLRANPHADPPPRREPACPTWLFVVARTTTTAPSPAARTCVPYLPFPYRVAARVFPVALFPVSLFSALHLPGGGRLVIITTARRAARRSRKGPGPSPSGGSWVPRVWRSCSCAARAGLIERT